MSAAGNCILTWCLEDCYAGPFHPILSCYVIFSGRLVIWTHNASTHNNCHVDHAATLLLSTTIGQLRSSPFHHTPWLTLLQTWFTSSHHPIHSLHATITQVRFCPKTANVHTSRRHHFTNTYDAFHYLSWYISICLCSFLDLCPHLHYIIYMVPSIFISL